MYVSWSTVVVSSSSYNVRRRDIVIMTITSQVRQPLAFGEATIADWQAGLIKQQHLVIRTMGRLSAADAKALREVIADVIG
jgi:mRNA interferase MazF